MLCILMKALLILPRGLFNGCGSMNARQSTGIAQLFLGISFGESRWLDGLYSLISGCS